MQRVLIPLVLLAVVLSVACSRPAEVADLKPGTSVTVTMKDGSVAAGRVVEAKADQLVIDPFEGGEWKTLLRANIASVKQTDAANTQATPPPAAETAPPANASGAFDASRPTPSASPRTTDRGRPVTREGSRVAPAPLAGETARPAPEPPRPSFREVTVPADTLLHVRLENRLASDTSHVEDAVRATLTKAITVDEIEAIPAGSEVRGVVTEAKPAGKVKGRASLAFRFDSVSAGGDQYRVRTQGVAREAQGTEKKDAAKIGIPAAGGAILGGILGGKKGAVIGGAVGGGAGTAVVLTTPGEELRLPAGTVFTVKLLEPLTVRVPVR